MTDFTHVSVLHDEALAALAPRDGGFYVDLTLGGAGHTASILDASAPTGRVLGVDRDATARVAAAERLQPYGDRATIVASTFDRFGEVLDAEGFGYDHHGVRRVDGILFDLGVSSPQLDVAERGFSYRYEGPLDMRMGDGETAAELIDRLPVDELAGVLRRFGDVKRPKAMAVAMKEERAAGQLDTTRQLAHLCERVLSDRRRSHPPATLVFQALRIAVNDELGQLDRMLAAIPDRLAVGGVAVAITFHSLEDRAVKHAFRALTQPPPLPRGLPVRGDVGATPFETVVRSATASKHEAASNPRARSARLRAIRRTRDEVPA